MANNKEKKKVSYTGAWKEARKIIWDARWRLGVGTLMMLVSRAASMVLPASTKFIGDEILTKQRYDLIKWIALAIGIATLTQGIMSFVLSQILGVAAQRAITEMKKRVQAHVTRLPVSYFDSTQTGQLISRVMNDAEGIRNLVGTGLGQVLGGMITAIASLCVLFYLNWAMTAAMLTVLLVFAAFLMYAFKLLRPVFRERGEITANVTGRLGESISGVRVVKAYTAEKREDLIFARGAHKLFRNIAKSVTGVSAITSFSSILVGAVAVIMIVLGGNAVQNGTMSLGDVLMYISFTFLLALPIFELTSIGTQITEALAGLDRIREVFAMTTESESDKTLLPLKNIKGDIEFKDVHFEYEKDLPVLKGVSFKANAGQTVALVGSSGSGKSTILSLVLNFIKPTSGVITVDEKDLQTVSLYDYRKFLGVVLQENFLFDGTVLDNIRFANSEASFEDIQQACKTANAHDFIMEFPEMYETVVGERGIKLSGGQRQRLAIARALLANPRILILDEATSSLDSESEAMIQDGLNNLKTGRTTFVIAHRLSTIRTADQILVVEHGQIVERGTHSELLAGVGRYKELYDKQYKFEQNLFVNPGEDFTGKTESSAAATKL